MANEKIITRHISPYHAVQGTEAEVKSMDQLRSNAKALGRHKRKVGERRKECERLLIKAIDRNKDCKDNISKSLAWVELIDRAKEILT